MGSVDIGRGLMTLVLVLFGARQAVAAEGAGPSPVGTYFWFPDSAGPRSDADCQAMAEKLKPSSEQAEEWLSGGAVDFDPTTGPYYLVLTKNRMEPTFSGEGDYDGGNIVMGPTGKGETPFTLVPDDHPDVTISGTILAPPDSQIVTVILKAVPFEDGTKDRTTYYCRFAEGEVT